ncbi:hypothetical protein ACFE04_012695 [Oxalis oulophora]
MGVCFLACFGSSKTNTNKHRHNNNNNNNNNNNKVQPNNQHQLPSDGISSNQQQNPQSLVQDNPITIVTPRDKPVQQLNSPAKKKVRFDSNVKTFGNTLSAKSVDDSSKTKDGCKSDINVPKPSNSQSSAHDDNENSSSMSRPPNHRYQNCRDSDDELDYGDIDIVDNEEDDDAVVLDSDGMNEDCHDRIPQFSRGRNVRSLLNPVENLAQWNSVKSKRTLQFHQQKENFNSEQESQRVSFSSEPKVASRELLSTTSFSNWLSMPSTKASNFSFDTVTPDRTISYGSISPRSFDDRPILGALTVEELKLISASSPRKSPNRSPDEMPIIGSVGTYWNQESGAKDCGSATSFKGIPNSTSKYREDKKVNWHSTPFEKQLEIALNSA